MSGTEHGSVVTGGEHWRASGLSADFRALFDAAPMPMLALAPERMTVVAVNEAYLAATMTGREQLVGREIFDVFPDDPGQADATGVRNLRTSLERVVATGQREAMPVQHYPVRDRDGVFHDRWWSPVNSPVPGPDGRVALIIHQVEDVTEWRATERALQASEAKFQAIANSIDQMIWATRADGFHDYFNDRWYEFTGVPYGSTDGDHWNGIFHPDDRDRAWSVWHRSLQTGEPYHIEYRLRHRSGEYRWVIGRAQPVRDTDRIVRWYGTCTDIHDLKQAETALRRLNETLENRVIGEVSRRMRTEEALRQSQKLEAIGQLTGGVAHDFNNLLTVIRSASDLLRRPGLAPEKQERYLAAISDTADRAAKLTSQLLAFARRQALKPEVFDVSARVQAIADMLRTVVGPRVALVADSACDICFVEADPTQFETALVNMAVNARDAMEGAGTLAIRIRPLTEVPAIRGHGAVTGPFVAVEVTDTGKGIAADQVARIFDPFFTTKEVGKGTGLGLSQVYGFAKQSGGEVDVQSSPGAGTRFVLYLPRVDAPAEAAAAPGARPDAAPGRGHLLVVEDNEQVGIFSTQLHAELGFETSWAANAGQALEMLEARAGAFVAVFSDVVMPGMSGLDLGREIRRRWPDLPVVLTSGYSHVLAADTRHGFELIHKPYSIDELTRVLGRAIRRPATG
jgi:PAS domain S-box-containing protein